MIVICSGGKTGVDGAALHVGVTLGLPDEDWSPRALSEWPSVYPPAKHFLEELFGRTASLTR